MLYEYEMRYPTSSLAMCALGDCLWKGEIIEKDVNRALEYYYSDHSQPGALHHANAMMMNLTNTEESVCIKRQAMSLLQELQMQGVCDSRLIDLPRQLLQSGIRIEGDKIWYIQETERLVQRKHPKGYEMMCLLYQEGDSYDELIELWKEAEEAGVDTFDFLFSLAGIT